MSPAGRPTPSRLRGALADLVPGGAGGAVAGILHGELETLALGIGLGPFATPPDALLAAVILGALAGFAAGGATGAALGMLSRPPRRSAFHPGAAGFAVALVALGWLSVALHLADITFSAHKLSAGSLAAQGGALSAAFLVLAALFRLGTRRRGAAGPPARAGRRLVAVAAGLAAVLLVPTGWLGLGARIGASPASSRPTPPARPHVIVVVLDTARADHISAMGVHLGLTPNIDALAARGTLFSRAYTAANWSTPSHASLFTGLYPSRHGAFALTGRLSDGPPTLAGLLSRAGYATASFYENPLLGAATGLDRGFDLAVGPEIDRRTQGTLARLLRRFTSPPGNSDRCLDLAEAWLRSADRAGRPAFAFVNVMAAHFPYLERQPFFDELLPPSAATDAARRSLRARIRRGRTQAALWQRLQQASPAELAVLRAQYASNIRYLDQLLGTFLGHAAADGLLSRSIVIVTADHGENLGEHGLFTHTRNALYDAVLRVPLVLAWPGAPAPVRVDTPVSLVDVLPTVLELTGLESMLPPGAQGTSLLRPDARRIVMSEYFDGDTGHFSRAAVSGELKLVVMSDGSTSLVDLAADPQETRDVAAGNGNAVSRLSAAMTALAMPPENLRRLDPGGRELRELEDRLRSLGYL